MEMENDKFFKLPKYAQNEINKLRNDVEYYKKKVNQIEGKEETNVYLTEGRIDNARPLPKNSQVMFVIKPEEKLYQQIEVRIREGRLEVSGYRTLRIEPRASNVIHIFQE